MKCDNCLNARRVISENGLHSICCLSEKFAIDCIMGKKDQRVPTMITLMGETEVRQKGRNNMKCPKCSGYTKVYDKRWYPIPFMNAGYNMRRRKCEKCGFKFVTNELYTRLIDGKDQRE